jgi:hypothetical protein
MTAYTVQTAINSLEFLPTTEAKLGYILGFIAAAVGEEEFNKIMLDIVKKQEEYK